MANQPKFIERIEVNSKMFASAQWFDESSNSRWPVPRGFRGWTFYLICLAGLLVPATILVLRGQFPEAGIWVLLGGAALWLELRGVRRELAERQAVSRLYVIDDTTQPSVETPQYELQLKRNP